MFAASWFVLDARWTWNLARQVQATFAQYGGKDWRGKHLAAEDGALFEFVEKARAELPAAPARIFVASETDYFRERAAFHLYPHNVYANPRSNVLPPPTQLKAGRLDACLSTARRSVRSCEWEGCAGMAVHRSRHRSKLRGEGAALFLIQ